MPYYWQRPTLSSATGPRETYVAIAIRPERLPGDGFPGEEVAVWHDGDHQRCFEIAAVDRDEPARFEFTDKLGRRFTLEPMTLAVYRREVAPRIPGALEFSTDEDLLTFFVPGGKRRS